MPVRMKRGYNRSRKILVKKYGKNVPVMNASASVIQVAVKGELAKNIETKQSNFTSNDDTEIGHNSFVNVDNVLLATTQGTDPIVRFLFIMNR